MPKQGPGRPAQVHVTATPEQLAELQHLVRCDTLPYGFIVRCRIVALHLAGSTTVEIAHCVGIGRRHVYKWLARFQEEGIGGLRDKRKGSSGRKKRQPSENPQKILSLS